MRSSCRAPEPDTGISEARPSREVLRRPRQRRRRDQPRDRQGRVLTLLGPSGSGKTTTLMMIAGFEEPSSGAIELGGEDLTRRRPYERNIGVVFQNYALFPHMTVERNVAFPLRMRAFPRAQQA